MPTGCPAGLKSPKCGSWAPRSPAGAAPSPPAAERTTAPSRENRTWQIPDPPGRRAPPGPPPSRRTGRWCAKTPAGTPGWPEIPCKPLPGRSPSAWGNKRSLEHLEEGTQNSQEQQRRRRRRENPQYRGTPSCHDRAPSFRSTQRAHRPSPRAMTRNSSTLATLRRW